MDDRALISRLPSGDPAAFAALYDRYARRVLGFLLRLTGNRAARDAPFSTSRLP